MSSTLNNMLHWQAPSALTHATWQAAHGECQALLAQASQPGGSTVSIDWTACAQVDSSALAFVLDLQRSSKNEVKHIHPPAALLQLASLYEVDGVLSLNQFVSHD